MVRVIVDIADPEQIILFGSQARRESRQGSDIDLLIIESDPFGEKRSRRKEMAKLWRALAPLSVREGYSGLQSRRGRILAALLE